MKLLLDQNISHRLTQRIEDIFPQSSQVRQLNIEGATDREIWNFAKDNSYTILTFDGDFYDFSLVWGHPPKIIWNRFQNQTTNNIEKLLRRYEQTIQDFLVDPKLACLEIIDVT